MFCEQIGTQIFEVSHKRIDHPTQSVYFNHIHNHCELLLFISGQTNYNIDGQIFSPSPLRCPVHSSCNTSVSENILYKKRSTQPIWISPKASIQQRFTTNTRLVTTLYSIVCTVKHLGYPPKNQSHQLLGDIYET